MHFFWSRIVNGVHGDSAPSERRLWRSCFDPIRGLGTMKSNNVIRCRLFRYVLIALLSIMNTSVGHSTTQAPNHAAVQLPLPLLSPPVSAALRDLGRQALVVGNGTAYTVGQLTKPESDAEAMEQVLRHFGFEVHVVHNGDAATIRAAVDRFAKALSASGGDGVVYYSGHGVKVATVEYLVPVDAEPGSNTSNLISLDYIRHKLSQARSGAVDILIIDACRDETDLFAPAARALHERNHAEAVPANNRRLSIYATTDNMPAWEGSEDTLSLFTQHWLDAALDDAQQSIVALTKDAAERVRLETGGLQVPVHVDALGTVRWSLWPPTAPIIAAGSESEAVDGTQADDLASLRPMPAPVPTGPSTVFADCSEAWCPALIEVAIAAAPGETRRVAVAVGEVTVAQWQACVNDGACPRPKHRLYQPLSPDQPVVNVSWTDVQHYLEWLGSRTSQIYRLPTAFEWDYLIAKWVGKVTLASGNERCLACGPRATERPRLPSLTEVLSGEPASAGIAGRVLEWIDGCRLFHHGRCQQRMARGAVWSNDDGSHLDRYWGGPGARYKDLGFRVLRVLS